MPHDAQARGPDGPEDAVAERLAAIDDRLGGVASADSASLLDDDVLGETSLADALDAILLLRQAAAADQRPVEPEPGLPNTVGRFQIVREVGRGGFAHVAEAIDPTLRRTVALKIARPEAVFSPEARRRFVREAEIAARLVHPQIVSIHEVGEAGGLVFIAEEYCAGGSLADWLERNPGPMRPDCAARLVRALAQAVAHAHAHAVVHRDIKPANVLLVPVHVEPGEAVLLPNERFSVKLCDFGLGKIVHAEGATEQTITQLTRSGARLGTPAWMAPEQVDASFGPVGPATDIHALGLLLDRLLTGRSQRAGRTDTETFRQVLLDDPRPADRVAAGVPRDLGAVCLRCLAKRPNDRYPSVNELAAELTRYLDGRPTLARPLSPLARGVRMVLRRPLVAGLAAAVVGATLIAGWSIRARSLETSHREAYRDEIRRHEATAELRRGFDAWRTGNVAGALGHLDMCASIDPALATSIAGRWLRRRTHGEQCIVLSTPSRSGGAPAAIHALAIAPDGATVAVGTADGRLLLAPATPPIASVVPASIAAHDEINGLVYSPDGSRIATVGQDGRLRLWDSAGRSLGGPPPTGSPLYGVCFTTDGKAVVYGGEDRVVRVVECGAETTQGLMARILHECGPPIRKDAEIESICRIDGGLLAIACGEVVLLLDERDGRVVRNIEAVQDPVSRITASPDGAHLLCVGHDRSPTLWSTADGTLVRQLPHHPGWVHGGSFSTDGRQIVTAAKDGIARVFDATDGRLQQRLIGHGGRVWDAAFESTGKVLTAGADGTLRRWDPAMPPDTAGLACRESSGEGVRAIIALPRDDVGPRVLTMQWDRPPCLLAGNGEVDAVAMPSPHLPVAVAYDPPRRRLAVEQKGPLLLVYVAEPDGEWRVQPLSCPDNAVIRAHAWTPGGELLGGCADGRLLLWDAQLSAAREVHRFGKPVRVVAGCATTRERIAAGIGKEVAVFERGPDAASSGSITTRRMMMLDPLPGDIQAIAWSPDGGKVACATNGGFVVLFDADTGTRTGSLAAHERDMLALAYSPDGRTLISADAMSVRFSDAHTLALFDELRPGWKINAVHVSADGRTIAVGGETIPSPESPTPPAWRVGIIDLGPPGVP